MGKVFLVQWPWRQSGEVSPCKMPYIIGYLSEEEVSLEIEVYPLPWEVPLLAGETEEEIDAATHGDSQGGECFLKRVIIPIPLLDIPIYLIAEHYQESHEKDRLENLPSYGNDL